MVAAVAALGRIGEAEQEALVAARESFAAARRAAAGKSGASRVMSATGASGAGAASRSIRSSRAMMSVDARRGGRRRPARSRGGGGSRRRFEIEVDQPMGVVEGRPEHLAARQVLEGRRDAAAQRHRRGVERLGEAEAGQGGAIGAGEKDRLDQVAARLLDRQRGDRAIVERAFAHHPIDGERKLLVDLPRRDLRRRRGRRAACRRAARGRCGSRARRP